MKLNKKTQTYLTIIGIGIAIVIGLIMIAKLGV
jgi:hypothetical protein